MHTLSPNRSLPALAAFDFHARLSRRSHAAAMLRRSVFCVLALSTPYAMFLLNSALRP